MCVWQRFFWSCVQNAVDWDSRNAPMFPISMAHARGWDLGWMVGFPDALLRVVWLLLFLGVLVQPYGTVQRKPGEETTQSIRRQPTADPGGSRWFATRWVACSEKKHVVPRSHHPSIAYTHSGNCSVQSTTTTRQTHTHTHIMFGDSYSESVLVGEHT